MEITINVNLNASPSLVALFNSLLGAKPETAPAKVNPLKKAESASDKSAATSAADTISTSGKSDDGITLETITSKVRELIKAQKAKAVKVLLDEFGVPKASELADTQYADFMEKLQKIA